MQRRPSVTPHWLSVTLRLLSATPTLLSVTPTWLSVTRRLLSATPTLLSVTRRHAAVASKRHVNLPLEYLAESQNRARADAFDVAPATPVRSGPDGPEQSAHSRAARRH